MADGPAPDLTRELRDRLGEAGVVTGEATARYAHDWTGRYRAEPLAVVRPADRDAVADVARLAARHGTPIVPVGGNTGLVGGTHAPSALMVSLERMNRIREVRPAARAAVVEAGAVLSDIHDAAEAHDLVFPLTFGAKGSARIGGCLSTNAGGSNVLRYGSTRALTLGLEVVLADGRVLDLMSALHKDNTGLDLKDLFIGAEGTLGIITAAVLKLAPRPLACATAMVAVPGIAPALDLLNRLQAATGGAVECFEYMPRNYVEAHMATYDGAREPFDAPYEHNVLVEVGATAADEADPGEDGTPPVVARLEAVLSGMLETDDVLDAVVARSEAQRREMWARREAAGELTVHRQPLVNTDVAVPLDAVEAFLGRARARLAAIDPDATDMTVAHLGDGNVHFTVWPSTQDEAVHDRIMQAVEDVTADLGGSFSAEHGIGLSKRASMARRKDPVALDVMARIKAALDPGGLMNPGKVLPGDG